MTEIEYEVREQDLIAFNEHQVEESAPLQKFLKLHQATIPGFIVVVALVLFFYFKDIPAAALVGIVGLAWGLGVPGFFKWRWRKQFRAAYTEEEKSGLTGTFKLRAENKDLVEIHNGEESRMPWGEILRIEVTRQYAFVFVSPSSALIIPRSKVRSGNLHEFVKTADERIEKAG